MKKAIALYIRAVTQRLSNMEILRIGQNLNVGQESGGGSYHMHALSRDQALRGHDITVLTPNASNKKKTRLIKGNAYEYHHIQFPQTIELLGNKLSAKFLHFIIDTTGFDVIHLHSHMYFSTFFAALINSTNDIPIVTTNHGLYSASLPTWISKLQLRSMGYITYSSSDSIICYTEADRAHLKSIGISSAINVVHNGIKTDRFTPTGDQFSKINPSDTSLLFVGRLVEGKGVDVVIKAFSILNSEHPGAELYICGDGPQRNQLEALVQDLDLENEVHMLGEIEYEKMPSVYRASDLLVLPSKTEGFPRTVLESLSCGVPVVTSDLPQLETVVSVGGRLASQDDPNQIAKEISQLLTDDKEYQKCAKEGRSMIVDDYSWTNLVDKTTRIMQNEVSRTEDRSPH